MKESDWKKFKKIKDLALEKYCANVLDKCEKQIKSNDLSNHEKYLNIYELIIKSDKKLAQIFDGHSRSRAPLQLMLIVRNKLIEEKDLEVFSDELLESFTPIR